MSLNCNIDSCTYTNKTQHLKGHKANVHNIGVVWKCCTLYDYKTKLLTYPLTVHKANVHDDDVLKRVYLLYIFHKNDLKN